MDSFLLTMRNICAFVLLSTVINNLLGTSSYRKYIRFFTGLVMIILVTEPLFLLFDIDNNLDKKLMYYFENEIMADSYKKTSIEEGIDARVQGDIIAEYKKNIDEEVIKLADECGYEVVFVEADIEKDISEAAYGTIYSLSVSVKKGKMSDFKSTYGLKEKIASSLPVDKKNISIEYIETNSGQR